MKVPWGHILSCPLFYDCSIELSQSIPLFTFPLMSDKRSPPPVFSQDFTNVALGGLELAEICLPPGVKGISQHAWSFIYS